MPWLERCKLRSSEKSPVFSASLSCPKVPFQTPAPRGRHDPRRDSAAAPARRRRAGSRRPPFGCAGPPGGEAH
jgi:hypothetical protein